MRYRNPVISGFHPDPSVCRVGRDYYLVTSTFEYFPGVPVFHSRDLVHWRLLGHCLTRPEQLPLAACPPSGGIYAPTIRHQGGRFYMTTTNTTGGGNFLVHAEDPAGPWSDPVWIEQPGIDPSLYFAEDGAAYFQSTGKGDGIYQSGVDPATGRLLSEPRLIWRGTGGRYPEAPHLYRIHGRYYLMIAEGGTEYGHMETIARADDPWGPFEPCRRNPILTHAGHARQRSPIQGTGHADLLEAHDGSWWLVFLAFRPAGGRFHHLGRETFLAPVSWDADGWPVVGADGGVDLEMEADGLAPHPWQAEPVRDDFDRPDLRPCWNFLRNPYPKDWSLSARAGWLRLAGSPVTLDDQDSPAFVGRRQQHFDCRVAALLEFDPADGEEGGLTVLANNTHHYEIALTRQDGTRMVIVRRRIGDLCAVVGRSPAPDGPVTLAIDADRARYTFSFASPGSDFRTLAVGATRYLSTEVAGGFTGVYLGMYATGNARRCIAPADFDWFDYTPGIRVGTGPSRVGTG